MDILEPGWPLASSGSSLPGGGPADVIHLLGPLVLLFKLGFMLAPASPGFL